jgi:2-oxo-4-hydroxy-4-carboxy-5-ureidoimidazoline decarboxylase
VRLEELNAMSDDDAERVLMTCCGSTRWAKTLVGRRPYGHIGNLLHDSDELWLTLDPADWDEAFSHHPRIGERHAPNVASAESARSSSEEQARVNRAADDVRTKLADANRAYDDRFGRTFIVAAAGKSAEEILAILERRLSSDPDTELREAANEQRKITWLRLEKLFASEITHAR